MNKSHWKGEFYRIGALAALVFLLAGCFQPIIPIRMMNSYPIDVFYEDKAPDRPYTTIQLLSTSEEKPLSDRQTGKDGALLYRGNTMEEKDIMIAKMVVQAQKLGADALVNVKYKVFTTAKTSGYTMEALAVKYRGD